MDAIDYLYAERKEAMKLTPRERIQIILNANGRHNVNARHVEAYVRVVHKNIGAMTNEALESDVEIAALCVERGGPESAEELARSFGMMPEREYIKGIPT